MPAINTAAPPTAPPTIVPVFTPCLEEGEDVLVLSTAVLEGLLALTAGSDAVTEVTKLDLIIVITVLPSEFTCVKVLEEVMKVLVRIASEVELGMLNDSVVIVDPSVFDSVLDSVLVMMFDKLVVVDELAIVDSLVVITTVTV
jgi:hypothetical protein